MPNPSEIERLELSICDNRTWAERLADEREAAIWNAIHLEGKQPTLQDLNKLEG